MCITTAEARALLAAGTVWTSAELVGRIDSFYLDDTGEHPTWVAVATAADVPMTFIPLENSLVETGRIVVPYAKSWIDSAPRADAGAVLGTEQIQVLQNHYRSTGSLPAAEPRPAEPAVMIRSEERLEVSTVVRPFRRLRVRKRVVTEYVTQTIPLRREELVIEEETFDPDALQTAADQTAMSDRRIELVLHAERPVMTTEIIAVERVLISVDVITDNTTVSQELRRENVYAETTDVNATGAV